MYVAIGLAESYLDVKRTWLTMVCFEGGYRTVEEQNDPTTRLKARLDDLTGHVVS